MSIFITTLAFLLNPQSTVALPPDSVSLSSDYVTCVADQQPKKTSGGWIINKSGAPSAKVGRPIQG